jgi:hypothetical protein
MHHSQSSAVSLPFIVFLTIVALAVLAFTSQFETSYATKYADCVKERVDHYGLGNPANTPYCQKNILEQHAAWVKSHPNGRALAVSDLLH